jgi:hypothetical protein
VVTARLGSAWRMLTRVTELALILVGLGFTVAIDIATSVDSLGDHHYLPDAPARDGSFRGELLLQRGRRRLRA